MDLFNVFLLYQYTWFDVLCMTINTGQLQMTISKDDDESRQNS